MNVISNAYQHTRKGVNPVIEISGYNKGDKAVFSVQDNGPGITSEEIEKIFDFFYRVNSKEKSPNQGIGLSIAQWACHKLGGDLWVESEIGKGSTFFISI